MEPVLADDEAVAAFARDGVVCLRSVLSEAEVATAAEASDAMLARPGPLSQVASGAHDPGVFVEDFCRWRDIPGVSPPGPAADLVAAVPVGRSAARAAYLAHLPAV